MKNKNPTVQLVAELFTWNELILTVIQCFFLSALFFIPTKLASMNKRNEALNIGLVEMKLEKKGLKKIILTKFLFTNFFNMHLRYKIIPFILLIFFSSRGFCFIGLSCKETTIEVADPIDFNVSKGILRFPNGIIVITHELKIQFNEKEFDRIKKLLIAQDGENLVLSLWGVKALTAQIHASNFSKNSTLVFNLPNKKKFNELLDLIDLNAKKIK